MEEKNFELLKVLVNKYFVFPIRRYNKKWFNKLHEDNNISVETINLLQQANLSVRNSYKLLKNNQIVDAATLMRSSLEKIMMAIVIYFDPEKTFEEFKNLEKCGKGKYTRPSNILNNFKLNLKEINPFLFKEFTDEELQLLLEGTYEKLCLYTHSSIAVSMMIEVNKNNDEDLFVTYFYLTTYFLEILIYCSLKYLVKDNKEHIDAFCIVLVLYLSFLKVDKNKLTENYINRYKKYLHLEINEHYNYKYKNILNKLQTELIELQNYINKNSKVIENYIKGLISK